MLKNKPIFTWRIEASGALYEAKINGFPLSESTSGNRATFEQPINDHMKTGKNRLSIYLFSSNKDGLGTSKVSVSLYIHRSDESVAQRVLIGQVSFDAESLKNGSGIEKSMPAATLDSKNRMQPNKNGDVTVYKAEIVKASIEPNSLHVYQDIELETPFPKWGFMSGENIDYPDAYQDFQDNIPYYVDNLIKPVYAAHDDIFSALQSKDISRILPFFEERNREMDIAYYEPLGTTQDGFSEAIKRELKNPKFELKILGFNSAEPYVTDDKRLVKLSETGLIYFAAKDESSYHNYEIWMYKKNGKWIVGKRSINHPIDKLKSHSLAAHYLQPMAKAFQYPQVIEPAVTF